MTRARKRTIGLVTGLLFGAAGVFGVAGWLLARPVPQHIGEAPRDLNGESVTVPVSTGRIIHGWFSPGRPGAGAVLLLHPLRGNRTTMLSRARFVRADGRAVLLVDLQGHGESPGSTITFGARESEDAHAALAYLRSRVPNERVAAIGWSLGGAAALLGPAPLAVDALVLEAVYPTIREAVADRLRIRLGALGPPLAPGLTMQLRFWTGFGADALRPIDAISRFHAPVLVIAGERDPRTLLSESRRLFAAANGPKELWVVPGAGHDDFHATHPAEYEARVRDFLTRYLGPAA
jgi:fermentation-respiration switch protein FrsA (DUF1100 family)